MVFSVCVFFTLAAVSWWPINVYVVKVMSEMMMGVVAQKKTQKASIYFWYFNDDNSLFLKPKHKIKATQETILHSGCLRFKGLDNLLKKDVLFFFLFSQGLFYEKSCPVNWECKFFYICF